MSDGRIVQDSPNHDAQNQTIDPTAGEPFLGKIESAPLSSGAWPATSRMLEALHLALRSMLLHRLRTFLAMLGIIIGIASVVCVVAIGDGAKQRLLRLVDQLNPSTIIDIHSGAIAADPSLKSRSLDTADLRALQEQDYVERVSPVIYASGTVQYRNVAASSMVKGVGEQYFDISGLRLIEGVFFNSSSINSISQDVVIDIEAKNTLFSTEKAIGQVIFIDGIPFRVIGVVSSPLPTLRGSKLEIFTPYTSAMARLTGNFDIPHFAVRIANHASSSDALRRITSLLIGRHGRMDFSAVSSDALRRLSEQTAGTMNLMVAGIAMISLLVGGIGVMNIMLVSVMERAREIGVRVAVGARQNDVRAQFLAESLLICLSGGILGIALALAAGWLIEYMMSPGQGKAASIEMAFSINSIVVAFGSASAVGVVFGFMPARRAAALDPVDTLART